MKDITSQINLTTKESSMLNLVVKYRKNPVLKEKIEETLQSASKRVQRIASFILDPAKKKAGKDIHAKVAKRLVSISERVGYTAISQHHRRHSTVSKSV